MKKVLSFLLLALFLFTCEKTDEIVDFRDKYVGIYKGIEIYGHVGDTVTWVSDTTSFNIEIKVDKIYDSSFVVTIDEFSFYTDYHFGNRYACKACT